MMGGAWTSKIGCCTTRKAQPPLPLSLNNTTIPIDSSENHHVARGASEGAILPRRGFVQQPVRRRRRRPPRLARGESHPRVCCRGLRRPRVRAVQHGRCAEVGELSRPLRRAACVAVAAQRCTNCVRSRPPMRVAAFAGADTGWALRRVVYGATVLAECSVRRVAAWLSCLNAHPVSLSPSLSLCLSPSVYLLHLWGSARPLAAGGRGLCTARSA